MYVLPRSSKKYRLADEELHVGVLERIHTMSVSMRRLEPDEVGLHRALRLRALSDSPDSFGETFAEASERPDTYWEELTRSVTDTGRHVMFVAFEGTNAIGSLVRRSWVRLSPRY